MFGFGRASRRREADRRSEEVWDLLGDLRGDERERAAGVFAECMRISRVFATKQRVVTPEHKSLAILVDEIPAAYLPRMNALLNELEQREISEGRRENAVALRFFNVTWELLSDPSDPEQIGKGLLYAQIAEHWAENGPPAQ